MNPLCIYSLDLINRLNLSGLSITKLFPFYAHSLIFYIHFLNSLLPALGIQDAAEDIFNNALAQAHGVNCTAGYGLKELGALQAQL